MMPMRMIPRLRMDLGGDDGSMILDRHGSLEGGCSRFDEAFREERPPLVQIQMTGGTGLNYADPELYDKFSEDWLLPRVDARQHALKTLAERLVWVGWVPVEEVLKTRSAYKEGNKAMLVLRRSRYGCVPFYCETETLPKTMKELEDRYYVAEHAGDRMVFVRLSGDEERPRGIVMRTERMYSLLRSL